MKRIINVGILAHVDAGKTSLTERLLFDNGVIDRLWSVDTGSTMTDSSELERERGITIRSAVVAFMLGDLQVNLVDTPGHPDFIAEVDRALEVLDAAILVVSAVEGVQAQTRVLMRSLRAAHIPTMIFINKIDRTGARPDAVLDALRTKLAVSAIPMNHAVDAGDAHARVVENPLADAVFRARVVETLAEYDMWVLARAVDGEGGIAEEDVVSSLRREIAACHVCPVFVGSALVGTGARELADGIVSLLPGHEPARSSAPAKGVIFAIERWIGTGKTAVLKLTEWELHERDTVHLTQRDHRGVRHEIDAKVTGLDIVGEVFDQEDAHARWETKTLIAGGIARVRGLAGVRVGARVWATEDAQVGGRFPQPTLESVIRPRHEEQQQQLRAALVALSDEDPLIQIRMIPGGATSVLLYGEVQKEVIAERLRREFGVETEFSKTSPVYIERPIDSGEAECAIDPLRENDFWATVGLRVSPTKIGERNRYVRDVIFGLMPAAFYRIVEESVMQTLEQGLYGWRVTDCEVRLTRLGFDRPITVAADFRCLVPIVLMRALRMAGTNVYEPCHSFELEAPDHSLSSILSLLSSHEARIERVEKHGENTQTVFGTMPVRVTQSVTASLSGLTGGEGSLMALPGADRRVTGDAPMRPRTDGNPLNYAEYMRYLTLEWLMS